METGLELFRWKLVKFTEEATSFPHPVPSPGRSVGVGLGEDNLLVLAAVGRGVCSAV